MKKLPSQRDAFKERLFLFITILGFLQLTQAAAVQSFVCDKDHFACRAKQRCISITWKCDGEPDCSDGEDEVGCPPKECKPETEFQCHNSRCIIKRWVCDGGADCSDGSDEIGCSPVTCDENSFHCLNSKCIPSRWRCDKQDDCLDNSDELGCGNTTCKADEFSCANGKCISNRWKCDKDDDCGDNSDELESNCESVTCTSNEMACKNGACIPKSWRCDGDHDCTDKSDEENCPANVTASTSIATCLPDFWKCGNGNCILSSWKCDGESDCTDGSDENCDRVSCPSNRFACASGRECVTLSQRCDGKSDCSDGSDENHCPTATSLCTVDHFNCSKDHCIDVGKVCNGVRDCVNGEDEPPHCFINECIDHNGHCLHNCTDLAIGYQCSCLPGYKLSSDQHSCEDVNECDIHGSCHQNCINTKGSFHCSCANGFILEHDGKTCKALDNTAWLYFANRHDIRCLRTDNSEYRIAVSGLKGVVGLDFDVKNKYIYWTDVIREVIQRARIDVANSTETIIERVHTPDGIAIDWINDKIYWTDTGHKTIEVSNLDGTDGADLIAVGLLEPRAIACDPNKGYIYWTDWGRQPAIERISMDGDLTTRTTLINTDIVWPNGLTLDFFQEKMYWMDAKLKRIEVARFDGSDRFVLRSQIENHPFAITNFEGSLYWTDWVNDAVLKASKFDSDLPAYSMKSKLFSPMDIQVYHSSMQPSDRVSPCKSGNTGCSHLCLLADSSKARPYSCFCPRGMYLGANGKTCGGTPVTRPPRTTTQEPIRTTPQIVTHKQGTKSVITGPKPTNHPTGKPGSKGSTKTDDHDGGSSIGMIIGIIIGIIVLLILIIAIVWYVRNRAQKSGNIMYYKDMSTTPLEHDFDDDEEKDKIDLDYTA